MNYRCLECGNIFEEGEQKKWIEPHGEELEGCPICFGAYEEVFSCKLCGSYKCERGEDYCEECVTETLKKFKAFVDEFTDEEKELLYDKGDIDLR